MVILRTKGLDTQLRYSGKRSRQVRDSPAAVRHSAHQQWLELNSSVGNRRMATLISRQSEKNESTNPKQGQGQALPAIGSLLPKALNEIPPLSEILKMPPPLPHPIPSWKPPDPHWRLTPPLVRPRIATEADLAKAILATGVFDKALEDAKRKAARDWARLKPGEKVLVTTFGLGLAGVSAMDPHLRGALHKTPLSLPETGNPLLDSMSIEFRTKNDAGLVLKFDLRKLFKE